MKEENMTFAQFIRRKRLESPEDLTLKDVAEKLGISLTMYSDIEKGRRVPSDTFNYEMLAELFHLDAREKELKKYEGDIWKTIHLGSYPELYANPQREWVDYYQSYVKTYLERDVNQLIKARNHLTFVKFMTAAAARTGQILNYSNIADEVGVSEVTVKEWISILEKSSLVYILKPYAPTALNRAIRTPKIYFRDTGLCCYLTRWLTPETLKNGAMAGPMFETFVINEILKSYANEGLDYDFSVYYYSGRDKKKKNKKGQEEEVDGEIDLIISENGILYPIEIKMSTLPKAIMTSEFDVLDGIPDQKRGMGYGKEMLQLAIRFAFDMLKAEKITLGVFENNEPAYRCYLAAGFRDKTGTQAEYYHIGNEDWKCLELEMDRPE